MNEPQKTFGDRRYQFGMLPAEEAFDVFTTVVRNLGEPLVKIMVDYSKGATKEGAMLVGMSAVGLVAKHMNSEELKGAIKKLLSVTACLDQKGGGQCEMNKTFPGKLLEMFHVAVEAFKVNFADFLAAMPSPSSPEKTTE